MRFIIDKSERGTLDGAFFQRSPYAQPSQTPDLMNVQLCQVTTVTETVITNLNSELSSRVLLPMPGQLCRNHGENIFCLSWVMLLSVLIRCSVPLCRAVS